MQLNTRLLKMLGAWVSLLISTSALGAGLPGSSIGNESAISVETMGMSCFAFDQPHDILPCNPGFIAQERAAAFRAHVFLGNNVSYLKEVTELLNGSADSSDVRDLFSRQETSELTAALNAGYLSSRFGVEITPMRISYVTLFQNRSLPEVQLFASFEESARVQFGSYIGEDLFWGTQVRYLHRRFIANSFFLTDILVENGKEVLAPHEQNSVYIEPSLLYAPETEWKPSASVSMMNTGFTDRKIEGLPLTPQYHLDFSVAPEFSWGEVSVGTDLLLDSNSDNSQSALTLGASYRYGILKIMGSLSRNANGFGFMIADERWNMGISYARQILQNALGDEFSERKVYLMVGVQF